MSPRTLATLLANLSVISFALIGYFQQHLAMFSVTTIVAFRVAIGAVCLVGWMAIVEREPFSRTVWTNHDFRIWSAVFACTVVLYGFAFVGRSLPDVCAIVGIMPLAVIGIDVMYYGRSFPVRNLIPVGFMFAAMITPSIYQVWIGNIGSLLSFGTLFAVLAALSHAAWVLISRNVDRTLGPTGKTNRTLNMFAGVGLLLIAFCNTEVSGAVERMIRGADFVPRLLELASPLDYKYVFFAGLFSAASVLLLLRAITFGGAAYVATFQYTLAIWGSLLALLPWSSPYRAEFTREAHMTLGLAAVVVAVAAFALFRMENSDGDAV